MSRSGPLIRVDVCNPQAAHDFGLMRNWKSLMLLKVRARSIFLQQVATADHKEIRGDEVDLAAVVQEIPGGIDDEW